MTMFAIAIIAILMASGNARHIEWDDDWLETISVFHSHRVVGLTESRRIWVKVGDNLPGRLLAYLIPPIQMGPSDHGKQIRKSFYLIRAEYLASLVLSLATLIAPIVVYVHQPRRELNPRGLPTPHPDTANHPTVRPEPDQNGEPRRSVG
jgi:hypothetical protein